MFNQLSELFGNFLDGKMGVIPNGFLALSYKGDIAVKTNSGYVTYDPDKKSFINVQKLAFSMGPGAFFLVPTKAAKKGDIVVVKRGDTMTVYQVVEDYSGEGSAKLFNYFTGATEEITPERHVFMQKSYTFGKVISIWNLISGGNLKDSKGFSSLLKINLLTGGKMNFGFGEGSGMNNLLPLILMGKEKNIRKFAVMSMMTDPKCNIFGGNNMLPLMLLGDGDIDPMMLMLMGNQGNSNIGQTMLLMNLFKDDKKADLGDIFGGFNLDFGDLLGDEEEKKETPKAE